MSQEIRQGEEKKKVKIWAHRGASAYAPDNSLRAFEEAVKLGADGVELDIQQTKDNVLVVSHDERLERTSNGAGWLKDHTYEQLRQLDFTGGFSGEQTGPVRIPAMEEVFALLQPTDLTINIELKTTIIHYLGIERSILEMAAKYGMEDRVIYSSFHRITLGKIHLLNPQAKTGLLYSEGFSAMPVFAKNFGMDALHPAYYNLLFPRFMDDCAENGLDVNVWTIDSEEQMLISFRHGVNAIITNFPDKARELARKMGVSTR